MELTNHPNVPQKAWNYLNDSYKTIVHLLYQPFVIACAVIHLAARTCAVPLPSSPPWYEVFDCNLPDMELIGNMILHLYDIPVNACAIFK
jgi:hypothetical protein